MIRISLHRALIEKFNHFKYLTALAVIKKFSSHKTYLQIIAVVTGYLQLLLNPRLLKPLLPLFIMLGVNLLVMFHSGFNIVQMGRLAQLLGMIGFCQFFVFQFNEEDESKLINLWEIFSILYFVLEWMYVKESGLYSKYIPGLRRFYLITGEMNFSAIFYLMLMLVSFHLKKYRTFTVATIFQILAGSRSGLVGVLCFILFLLAKKTSKTFFKVLVWVSLFGMLSYPFALLTSDYFFNPAQKRVLSIASSNRYYLHLIYAKLGIQNPLGVGYFQGVESIKNFYDNNPNYVQNKLEDPLQRPQLAEQHSLFIQIFSEFGLVGYLLFCGCLLQMSLILYSRERWDLFVILFPFLSACMFLNVLHEVALYFLLAYVLKRSLVRPCEYVIGFKN